MAVPLCLARRAGVTPDRALRRREDNEALGARTTTAASTATSKGREPGAFARRARSAGPTRLCPLTAVDNKQAFNRRASDYFRSRTTKTAEASPAGTASGAVPLRSTSSTTPLGVDVNPSRSTGAVSARGAISPKALGATVSVRAKVARDTSTRGATGDGTVSGSAPYRPDGTPARFCGAPGRAPAYPFTTPDAQASAAPSATSGGGRGGYLTGRRGRAGCYPCGPPLRSSREKTTAEVSGSPGTGHGTARASGRRRRRAFGLAALPIGSR